MYGRNHVKVKCRKLIDNLNCTKYCSNMFYNWHYIIMTLEFFNFLSHFFTWFGLTYMCFLVNFSLLKWVYYKHWCLHTCFNIMIYCYIVLCMSNLCELCMYYNDIYKNKQTIWISFLDLYISTYSLSSCGVRRFPYPLNVKLAQCICHLDTYSNAQTFNF